MVFLAFHHLAAYCYKLPHIAAYVRKMGVQGSVGRGWQRGSYLDYPLKLGGCHHSSPPSDLNVLSCWLSPSALNAIKQSQGGICRPGAHPGT